MGKARDHHLSHLEQAKYMRKSYVLVSGIFKKSVQLKKEVKICIIVPVYYISFNASHIHDIKKGQSAFKHPASNLRRAE